MAGPTIEPARGRRHELNHAAAWAGGSAFLLYAFVMLPLQVSVAHEMGLADRDAARWILVVWATGGVATIALSLAHRQPLAITWSVLGLVYLGAMGGRFTLPELVGANLVAGVTMLALALLGGGERMMRLVPLPVVVAMFAGSILGYVTGAVSATAEDAAVAGAAVGGYALARALGLRRVPPVALAALTGTVAAVVEGRLGALEGSLAPPVPAPPGLAFSADAVLTLSPALVVLALALGHIQGLGLLRAEGYRVPVDRVSVALGAASIVNALLGGHQATVGRATTAIVGGPEAGPRAGRYWASVIAGALCLLIAVGAGLVSAVVGALPASLVAVLTGLALLSALQDSLEKAFTGQFRFGALVAFVVAAAPVSALGVGAASWALLAGLAACALDPAGPAAAYRRRVPSGPGAAGGARRRPAPSRPRGHASSRSPAPRRAPPRRDRGRHGRRRPGHAARGAHHLAGVHPDAHRAALGRGRAGHGQPAPDRPGGAVEERHRHGPGRPPRRRSAGRAGERPRPAGRRPAPWPAPGPREGPDGGDLGQEGLDHVEDLVGLERDAVVAPGQLDQTRAGDPLGEVAALLGPHHAVVGAVHDERRDADGRQDRTDVDREFISSRARTAAGLAAARQRSPHQRAIASSAEGHIRRRWPSKPQSSARPSTWASRSARVGAHG